MAGYPVQGGHPPAITWEGPRRRMRDSGTLSGTSAEEEQMTGKIMPLRERDTGTIQAAADAFLSSPRYANPNTRRSYTGVLDRLLAGLGASRPLAEVSGGTGRPAGAALGTERPGDLEPQPWRRDRLAVLVRRRRLAAPVLPTSAERRREHLNATRGAPPGDRADAVPSRRSAAGEDPVADALRDRRSGQRGAGAGTSKTRPGRPPRPDPLQGRRHRMDLLGLRHCTPAAPPYARPPGWPGVPVRAPSRPRLPPRGQGPVSRYRTGPARV